MVDQRITPTKELAELVGRLKVIKRRLEREQEMVDLREASDDEMSVVADEAMSVDRFMKNILRKTEIHISGSSTYFHEFPANMKIPQSCDCRHVCFSPPPPPPPNVSVVLLGNCSHEQQHTNKWKMKGKNAKRPLRKRAKTNNIQWKESEAISTCSLQSCRGVHRVTDLEKFPVRISKMKLRRHCQ